MASPQLYLQQYLAKTFFLNPFGIAASKTFDRDLGLNSQEFIEVVAQLETLYNVNLPDDVLSSKLSVGQLSNLVLAYSAK
jgi:acyl carrier protein